MDPLWRTWVISTILDYAYTIRIVCGLIEMWCRRNELPSLSPAEAEEGRARMREFQAEVEETQTAAMRRFEEKMKVVEEQIDQAMKTVKVSGKILETREREAHEIMDHITTKGRELGKINEELEQKRMEVAKLTEEVRRRKAELMELGEATGATGGGDF
ncbi:MAG: hypothetical protein Q9166_004482 [cf. Caloplaca sp. 2 TL-2023]